MQRNKFIDFLKGICIIFVIVTHYAWLTNERKIALFPFWVDMAVPIFMIISGYVYSKSFVRNGISTFEGAYHPQNIYSKLIRYTIPYAVIFVFQIVLGIINGADYSILQIIKLFFVGGQGPGSYYYPIMVQFVFLFPVIFMLVAKKQFKGVLFCAALTITFEISKWAYGMGEETYRLLIFRYIFLIAVGCYIVTLNKNHKQNVPFNILLCIGSIMFTVLTYYGTYKPIFLAYWTSTCIIACLFIVPIMIFLLLRCSFGFPPINFLGKASFHIFLIQMLYYNNFSNKIYTAIENRSLELLVSILICLIGGIIFYLLETPISKHINKKIKSHYQKAINTSYININKHKGETL